MPGEIGRRAASPLKPTRTTLPEGVESMPMISDRVELARRGANDAVICRLPSGWAVVGDVQFLPGYCLLLADPVVASLNDLNDARRAEFLRDMARLGDALLHVIKAKFTPAAEQHGLALALPEDVGGCYGGPDRAETREVGPCTDSRTRRVGVDCR